MHWSLNKTFRIFFNVNISALYYASENWKSIYCDLALKITLRGRTPYRQWRAIQKILGIGIQNWLWKHSYLEMVQINFTDVWYYCDGDGILVWDYFVVLCKIGDLHFLTYPNQPCISMSCNLCVPTVLNTQQLEERFYQISSRHIFCTFYKVGYCCDQTVKFHSRNECNLKQFSTLMRSIFA